MEELRIHYKLKSKRKYIIDSKEKNNNYELFSNKDIFIRLDEEQAKLKIRTPKKYPFLRIKLLKTLNEFIWIGKIPNTEDLITLTKINNDNLEIKIFLGKSKHLTLYATMQ